MAPKWNDTQRQAIDARGVNTIVSAGAGSGKTAVLTERVAQLVSQGHPISSMLVLTFTNAAAAEMKERIRDRLLDLHLDREATRVDSAYIMTFDAFALSLVRRYHYALGLEPDVGILEENILNLLRKRTIADIFERYYERQDARFLNLVKAFAVRSDEGLRHLVIELDRMTDLKPNRRAYYENYVSDYFKAEYIEASLSEYRMWIDGQLSELLALVERFSHEDYRDVMHTEISTLALTDDFDMKITSIKAYSFPNARKYDLDETQKSDLKRIKGRFGQLQGKLAIGSKNEITNRYLKTKPHAAMLVELATRLDDDLTKLKQKHNRFSFADVAKMAIRLVSDEAIRAELTDEFRFIMIDEYQDTNDLQDRFVNHLARGNVFMVGDVKQSIYRFRNANCALFTQKYDDYLHSSEGQVIDMNTNYRSRKEVIDAINRVFGKLMKVPLGGVDYQGHHEIGYGQTAYDDHDDGQADYGLTVYNYEAEGTDEAIEKEIHIIARDIIAKLNQKRLVYDKDSHEMRPIVPADMAILIDRRSSFKTYVRVFEQYGLPLEVQFVDEMKQSDVLNVFENLIRLVAGHGQSDYPQKYRHELASVWRSFLYRDDDQSIFLKLKDLSNNQSDPLLDKIADIARLKDQLPLGELIAKIALDFELHQETIHLGDVLNHAGRIEELIRLAAGLQDIGMSIEELVAYFDDAVALKAPLVLDTPKMSSGVVKLMTIHQSKGLEFPVVYYPGLFRQFNLPEETSSSYAHGRYGLVLPVYEDEEPYSFFHHLVRAEEKQAALSEEMRKLYVALTRTRETMVVLMKAVDEETTMRSPRSFADFLRLASWSASADHPLPEPQETTRPIHAGKPVTVDFRQLNIVPVIKKTVRASQARVADRAAARYGTRLHDIMSRLDYRRPAYEDIPEDSIRDRIAALLALPPLEDAHRARAYQEYSFYDPKQDLFGTIDLMLVYENRIDIIDFKTGSLDHNYYDDQLRAYHRYVASITDLPIKLYLVSLTRDEYRAVKSKEVQP
jgi:ATP-dependent helicase/nuclease subunit A